MSKGGYRKGSGRKKIPNEMRGKSIWIHGNIKSMLMDIEGKTYSERILFLLNNQKK